MAPVLAKTPLAPVCKLTFSAKDKCFFGSIRDPESGRSKSKFIPRTITDEPAARAWLIDFEQQLFKKFEEANSPSAVLPTVRSLVPKWDEHLNSSRTNRNGETLDDLTVKKWLGCIRNHVLNHKIADLPLSTETFTPYDAVEWVIQLKKNIGSTYFVRDCVLALRYLIGDARKLRWVNLYANPLQDEMVNSEIPSCAPQSGKDNPIQLSEKQVIRLLTTNADIPFARRVFTLLAIGTGMRIREIQALAWKHVDFEEGTIEVERQMKTGGRQALAKFKPPKYDSYRTIPMHPLVQRALAAWRLQFPPGTLSLEAPVFPRIGTWDTFDMWHGSIGTAALLRHDLKLAGLPDLFDGKFLFDFHSLRRTFLTLLDDAGAPADRIGGLAGHAQKGVRRHYIKQNIHKYRPIIEMLPFGNLELPWLKKVEV